MTAPAQPRPDAVVPSQAAAPVAPATPAAPAGRRFDPPRVAALVLGPVYVLVGVIGTFITGWSDWTSMHGTHLLVFQVNPLHNVAHIGLGAALVVGGLLGGELARSLDRLVGGVFLLLALFGPLLMGGSADVLAFNDADHLLHLGTTAVLLGAVWLGRPRRAAAGAPTAA